MKTIQRNKIKFKIFEEDELREKLLLNDKNMKIVLDYQNRFPELMIENGKGFVIDGEKLCNELGVNSNFNDWLLRPTKGKEGKLIKYRCVENTDFISISEKSEKLKGGRPKNKITLTLNTAKKIAMRQNNEQGDLVCDYFILMEETLKNYKEWNKIREPEKYHANELKSWAYKNFMNCDEQGIYAREFNMINQNLCGKTALEIKTFLGYKDKRTREHLSQEINSEIDNLQIFDIQLLRCNKSFEERNDMIKQICDSQYPQIKEYFK
ncbi:hypothetical protein DVV91_17270 [Clostridium botulinum]|uniref:antA/AntB antirepressor family protein n=1 Tax=Clostridium botulinum TaxID=1491 RepID=UPI001967D801|nr:antA/AntB antirepressor family protein [Clostridium botulinum]MBN1076073.1 hypothetical protein [Clostridium botulinum]